MNSAMRGTAPLRLCLMAMLLVCNALTSAYAAADTNADVFNVQGEACLLECGSVLADCERQRARGAHCARDHQMCRGDCGGENRRQPLGAKERQQRLCQQRCELSTALCEQDAAQQQKLQHCTLGVSQCKARC